VSKEVIGNLHYAETAFGFEYGAATVERACSDRAKGWVVMLLRTPKYPDGLQLYVTKTGKVRVFAAGQEWKPPPST
jgi:hypothetical protein